MELTALTKFGLTEGESKVYLALLRIGVSTVGNIVKESHVSSSKIYDILDRLSKNGLVSSVIINNRKNFAAQDPSRLREFIEVKETELAEQKKELDTLVPDLQKIRSLAEPLEDAEIMQGVRGIKTFWEMAMNKLGKGDTVYLIGIPKGAEKLQAYFSDWNVRRVKKGILCKMIFNYEVREIAKLRKEMILTNVRLLPENVKTPAYIGIAGDYVAIIILSERPFCIVMKNREIVESYISYFNLFWKMANKV